MKWGDDAGEEAEDRGNVNEDKMRERNKRKRDERECILRGKRVHGDRGEGEWRVGLLWMW